MSITFIKELEHVYPNRKFAIADLDDLVLDTFNPRFSSSTLIGSNSQATQEDIISYLVRFGKLKDLIEGIHAANDLYPEEWISCYTNSAGKIVVLEGNRRIAACKLILDHTLIPPELADEQKINYPTSPDTLSRISKIRILLYEHSEDAQGYIAAKHTKPEIKKWETIEQCNYYFSQFSLGMDPRSLSLLIDDDIKNVTTKIKQYGIFHSVFTEINNHYPDICVEDVNILPLVTKFFPPLTKKKSKVGLNLKLNETTYLYEPAPEKADIYQKILFMIGEAFFVRPKATNAQLPERESTSLYRISTNEIRNTAAVVDLIINDTRIPGLYKLIQEYQSGNFTAVKLPEESAPTLDPTPQGTTPPVLPQGTHIPSYTNPDRPAEFFSDLHYQHISPITYPGLYNICAEIVKISTYYSGSAYKQFPISSAFLLRSLIEQVLNERLKQLGKYTETDANGKKRTPKLEATINIYLKNCQSKNYTLFWNDVQLAEEFNKCFSGHGTKGQLDTIVHNPQDILPDTVFLNGLANQGIKNVLQGFLNHLNDPYS